jgi:hypothetical protein
MLSVPSYPTVQGFEVHRLKAYSNKIALSCLQSSAFLGFYSVVSMETALAVFRTDTATKRNRQAALPEWVRRHARLNEKEPPRVTSITRLTQ